METRSQKLFTVEKDESVAKQSLYTQYVSYMRSILASLFYYKGFILVFSSYNQPLHPNFSFQSFHLKYITPVDLVIATY